MTKGLKRAVKMGIEGRRELEAQLERGRDLTSQIVLLEERFEAMEKKSMSEQRKFKEAQREAEKQRIELAVKLQHQVAANQRLDEDQKRSEAEIRRLSSQLLVSEEALKVTQSEKASLEQKLTSFASRIAQLDSIAPHQPSGHHLKDLDNALKRIAELENEKTQWSESLESCRVESKAAEAVLLAQIESLNEGLATSQEQCTQLSLLSSRLQTEIFEQSHTSDSNAAHQNDILNQRLLSHYRYLITLTEEEEEGGRIVDSSDGDSDSEAWK